ncbi:MAG: type II toxin-antitoxin system Phd/YefM family antitoxin [Patescibacteria group bacterium]
MNTKTTIPITEARIRFFEIVEAVNDHKTVYTLTKNGRPTAVIISAVHHEKLKEKVEGKK